MSPPPSRFSSSDLGRSPHLLFLDFKNIIVLLKVLAALAYGDAVTSTSISRAITSDPFHHFTYIHSII